METAGQSI